MIDYRPRIQPMVMIIILWGGQAMKKGKKGPGYINQIHKANCTRKAHKGPNT